MRLAPLLLTLLLAASAHAAESGVCDPRSGVEPQLFQLSNLLDQASARRLASPNVIPEAKRGVTRVATGPVPGGRRPRTKLPAAVVSKLLIEPDGDRPGFSSEVTVALEKIYATEHGRAMLDEIARKTTMLTIRYGDGEMPYYDPKDHSVGVDPGRAIGFMDEATDDCVPMSFERVLAHELAHATGEDDEPKGTNVDTHENPIATSPQWRERIRPGYTTGCAPEETLP